MIATYHSIYLCFILPLSIVIFYIPIGIGSSEFGRRAFDHFTGWFCNAVYNKKQIPNWLSSVADFLTRYQCTVANAGKSVGFLCAVDTILKFQSFRFFFLFLLSVDLIDFGGFHRQIRTIANYWNASNQIVDLFCWDGRRDHSQMLYIRFTSTQKLQARSQIWHLLHGIFTVEPKNFFNLRIWLVRIFFMSCICEFRSGERERERERARPKWCTKCWFHF